MRWVLAEPDADKALGLRQRLFERKDDFFAPDVFATEVAHSLTRAERQRRILVGQAKLFYTYIMATTPDLHSSLNLIDSAIQISSMHRVGTYDCLFVALAEQMGCEMITCDERLISNLQPLGFPVVSLGSV